MTLYFLAGVGFSSYVGFDNPNIDDAAVIIISVGVSLFGVVLIREGYAGMANFTRMGRFLMGALWGAVLGLPIAIVGDWESVSLPPAPIPWRLIWVGLTGIANGLSCVIAPSSIWEMD